MGGRHRSAGIDNLAVLAAEISLPPLVKSSGGNSTAKVTAKGYPVVTAHDFRTGFAETNTYDRGFDHEYGGILGPDLFHYHEALIDLGNRALYLKPDLRSHRN